MKQELFQQVEYRKRIQYEQKEQEVKTFKQSLIDLDTKIEKAEREKMYKKDLILKGGADIQYQL